MTAKAVDRPSAAGRPPAAERNPKLVPKRVPKCVPKELQNGDLLGAARCPKHYFLMFSHQNDPDRDPKREPEMDPKMVPERMQK